MGESESRIASTSKTPKEHLFRKKRFGTVVQALWNDKPALNLAQRGGFTERAAQFYINGERKPSWRAIRAVIDEISE